MIQFFQKRLNKKGFTLIELIVVIAILGILAAIAIPRVAGFTESAKVATDKEAVAVVANAAAMYYASDPTNHTTITTSDLTTANLIKSSDLTLTSSTYSSGTWSISVASGVVTATITSGSNTYSVSK